MSFDDIYCIFCVVSHEITFELFGDDFVGSDSADGIACALFVGFIDKDLVIFADVIEQFLGFFLFLLVFAVNKFSDFFEVTAVIIVAVDFLG